MDKMRMESVDITDQNIEKIGALFPNVITEAKDENGKLTKAINFELLRQELSRETVDSDEVYEFTWVGKKAAIVEANKPVRKTLRPCKEESVNWDTTENLYIEGDNLEVLKLLQESYLGKVKMIYIDPPYNTGNDFIYEDDFARTREDYDEDSGAVDENGDRMFKNTDSNGRFHSDWCSMIYSRLSLARNLLTDDGVILISIDDREQDNLEKICNEIFGEDCFLGCVARRTQNGVNNKAIHFSPTKDYVLVYGKQTDVPRFTLATPIDKSKYKYIENEDSINAGKRYARGESIYKTGLIGDRPNSVFEIECPDGEIVIPPTGKHFKWSKKRFEAEYNPSEGINRIIFQKANNSPLLTREGNRATWNIYEKKYLDENIDYQYNVQGDLLISSEYTNNSATQELRELNIPFDYPKPVSLIKYLAQICHADGATIVDFFSGSAATADAVMQLNAEDTGSRKFIMVQLPEKCDEKSEAYKAGYANICEIGKERIRRAAKKIHKEHPDARFDDGFRVLKVDESNMTDVYYSADSYDQNMLDQLESNIKADRTDLDLLFGCLLEWGLPLSMPYTSENVEGCTVHTYNDGDLVACFNNDIPESVIKEIAKRKPLRAVFRDSGFKGSPEKINVGETFKLLSPDTRVKII